MTINARDVIVGIIGELLAEEVAPTCCGECASVWMEDVGHAMAGGAADRIIAAQVAAAGVEPGGRLVIEHADGWPLGRLEPAHHYTNEWSDFPDQSKWHTIPLYRVVVP